KVAGSNPAPATKHKHTKHKTKQPPSQGGFLAFKARETALSQKPSPQHTGKTPQGREGEGAWWGLGLGLAAL
ncbi:hypothetical protein, partial [Methylobacterium organophilum]|uniref:hypothetical protein n=1 Tax=Methylobacterium organophilum TaxID=410 RepID=UPI001EE27D1D